MSATDLEHRPTKKRRFFVDDPQDVPCQDALNATSSALSSRPSSSTSVEDPVKLAKCAVADTQSHELHDRSTHFDLKTFAAIVGEDVSPSKLQQIREVAGDDIERAINVYFDGSWRAASDVGPTRGSQCTVEVPALDKPAAGGPNPEVRRRSTSPGRSNAGGMALKSSMRVMPKERYVGAFGVGAWSTKSGTGLVSHGEKIRIERSKIVPKMKVGRGGRVVQVSSRNQKSDVVTRFTNAGGEEVGRLPEETAKWVSTLLDQNLCRLDGTCVYAPERLRVNDTIYLQLKCYFLRTAFNSGAFLRPNEDNRVTGIFEEQESREEKNLRLRQVALVRLFDEINLHPTTTNEMMLKHKKDGILKAAEMAEHYDKEKPKKPGEDTSSPQSEQEDGQELEEDQLNTLYQKAQSFDFSMPEAEPADTFVLSLRKYQKQALHWMLSKERDTKSSRLQSMHPLWEAYQWPIKDVDDHNLPVVESQAQFFVNPYSGELSLDFPVQDQTCLGGILADEMGLGKTIEMLSLMHSNRSEVALAASGAALTSVNSLPRLPQTSSAVEPAPCTTLVVAPMSLLAQWESEATKASRAGSMKSLVYYGNDKAANLRNLCCAANAASAPSVIITSYGTVLSESNQVADMAGDRGSHGGLFSVEFFRVILDEAHTIKNRQSKTAKACYEIQAKHRWVLTGTPIVNRLEDLFSLVRFLKVEPWSNFSFWKTFITVPFEQKDIARAINVVQTVLEPLVLRRTKDMKTPEGEALVPLPPRTITIEEIELSKAEREVYDFVFMRAKRAFNASLEAGTLLKSYTTIFAQILRLRQSCCHPVLTRNQAIVAEEEDAAAAENANGFRDDMDLQELIDRFTSTINSGEEDGASESAGSSMNFTTHALRQIQAEACGECPICAEEPMVDPAVTACWHSACKKCLEDYIAHQTDKGEKPRCFSCRETINPRDIFEVVRYGSALSHAASPASPSSSDEQYGPASPSSEERSGSKPRISLRRLHPLSPSASTSAKIAALVRHLLALPRKTKSVVFSQFTSFLDLIAPQLLRHGLSHLRFDGSMAQKQRAQVLRDFSAEDAEAPKILLLSLRAGGVGLNLTAANRVFMMDPWWSFAIEAQAIDRVHRMGQTDQVHVTRFVVKDSIEGRMLRVQDRKMAVAGSLGVGQSQGEAGEEEKKRRRIEELEMLLG